MNNDEIRAQLQSYLQQGGPQAQLTISSTTFDFPNIAALLNTYYAGNTLVIQNAVMQPADGGSTQTTVCGTAPFMNVEKAPVCATFQEAQNGVDLILKYQLPPTWRFSQSFPALPISWDFRAPLDAPQHSYLDLLTITDAYFIVSTIPHTDQPFQVQVSQGLTFVGHLHLNGILGTLEQTLHIPQPLTLSGPIILLPPVPIVSPPPILSPLPPGRNSAPLPGINLKAEAQVDLGLEQIKLSDVFIRLYSPLTTEWLDSHPMYHAGMFFGGDLHIGTHLALEVIAEKVLGVDNALVLTGRFDGLNLPSLSEVADLVGADDLLSSLTPQTSTPALSLKEDKLSIEAISLSITTSPLSIDSVYLLVGLQETVWQAIDGFIEVDSLAARFQVDNPFNAQRRLEVTLIGNMAIDNVPFTIVASAPEFTIRTELSSSYTLSLTSLMSKYIPEVPAVSDLTIEQLYLEAQPGQAFSLIASLADQPQPWVIDLGPTPLAISNVQLALSYAKGSGASGILGGTLSLAGVSLTTFYQFPGSLSLRGQLPTISLKTLVTGLCGTVNVWPAAFDLTLSNSRVRIEKQPTGYELQLGTQVDNIGSLALQVGRFSGTWAFAAGVDLPENWKLSTISSALALFDNSFSFNKMVLVLSTLDSPAFTFPDLASFNDPTITSTKIVLPRTATGVTKGFNFFAEMTFGGEKSLELIKKMLQLDQATLDIVIQIGENPTNSTLSANIGGQINSAIRFTGALRVMLKTDEVAIGMLGSVGITVQNHPLLFTGEIEITENGAYLAATMQGSWIDAFTIQGLTLSDIALEFGCDWEGVPTVGLAATLDIKGKNGSIAIVFDSITPSKSLLAGSMSNLTMTDLYEAFIGSSIPLPSEIASVLDQMALKGIPLFTIPLTLTAELDKGAISPAIVQAFSEQGKIALGGDMKQTLLVVGTAGSLWYLTDRTNLKHYTITKQGDQLQVALEVQLAIVPDPTMIGQLVYPQGIRVAAAMECLSLNASARVEIDTRNGILVDGTMTALDFGEIFRLTGHNGQGDPLISLATYDVPTSSYRGPHCVFSGALTILECTRDLDLEATRDGIKFSLAAKIFNAFQASVAAQCPLDHFATAEFSVAATMDNDLFTYLKTRGTAAIEQAASSARTQITQAQGKVDDAQRQVDSLNGQISAKTAEIQAERAQAQRALNDAQGAVNSIQAEIDANQGAINQLNREIEDLKNDIRSYPWNALPDGAIITEKEVEIGGHQAAIHLESGTLATANATLEAAKRVVVVTPIEADPRVASLYVKLKTGTAGLQAGRAFLEEVKQANGKMASVADWLAQHDPDQLLTVTHAAFAGQLHQVSSGSVIMSIDLSFMGRPYHLNQDFNFHDLDKTISNFVEQLKQYI